MLSACSAPVRFGRRPGRDRQERPGGRGEQRPRWCAGSRRRTRAARCARNRTVPSGWWQAPAPVDQARPPAQVVQLPGVRAGVGQLGHGRRDRRQAVQARPALPSGLERQGTGHPGGLDQAAAVGGKRRQHPGADERAYRAKLGVAQRQPGRLRRGEPGAVVPADQHGPGRGEVEQLASGVPIAASATSTEPLACRSVHSMMPGSSGVPAPGTSRPVPRDQRQVRERLYVLDQRRAAGHATLEYPRRRELRRRGPAADPAGERGLLAGQEAGRRPDDLDRSRSGPYASRSGK